MRIIQGEFFIMRHRNISRNTHRTEKIFEIKFFYFQGRKATPQKPTPHPGEVG